MDCEQQNRIPKFSCSRYLRCSSQYYQYEVPSLRLLAGDTTDQSGSPGNPSFRFERPLHQMFDPLLPNSDLQKFVHHRELRKLYSCQNPMTKYFSSMEIRCHNLCGKLHAMEGSIARFRGQIVTINTVWRLRIDHSDVSRRSWF